MMKTKIEQDIFAIKAVLAIVLIFTIVTINAIFYKQKDLYNESKERVECTNKQGTYISNSHICLDSSVIINL